MHVKGKRQKLTDYMQPATGGKSTNGDDTDTYIRLILLLALLLRLTSSELYVVMFILSTNLGSMVILPVRPVTDSHLTNIHPFTHHLHQPVFSLTFLGATLFIIPQIFSVEAGRFPNLQNVCTPECGNPARGERRNEMLRFATGTSEEKFIIPVPQPTHISLDD